MFPNVYARAEHPDDLSTRSKAAYLLVRGQHGVVAGYSAALLLGADCAPSAAPAEVLVARNTRSHPGLTVYYGSPEPADLTYRVGLVRAGLPAPHVQYRILDE
ncbi:hypothetical protein ACTXG6_13595 [Pseudonocardia sp. Cha107L01]|uniref:hypothetical protein n=1 Tax=Pseudonocardia sp. Cha107L01 TaxID=3457576 RepID=UPI00403EB420